MPGVLPFVMQYEGWNPKAYGDYKQTSVGYGTKARYPGEVIDKAEGERRLQSELAEARGYVAKKFPNLAPNQTDALTSFTYNLGPGWMNQPTRLRAALERGDHQTAAAVMREYNKAGGEVLPGLVKRRSAEAEMFLGGAAPPLSAASPVSPALPEPTPMADEGFSWAKAIRGTLEDPMFNSGLGGFLAAARGGDVNAGMQSGTQQGLAMQRSRQQAEEMARRKRLEAAFGQANFQDVSPEIANIARMLGPEAGGNLIAKSIMDRQQQEQAERMAKMGYGNQLELLRERERLQQADPLRGAQKAQMEAHTKLYEAQATAKQGQAPLTAGEKQAVLEAEDQKLKAAEAARSARDALALNDKAYEGPTAGIRGKITAYLGDEGGLATSKFSDIVGQMTLESLKPIFGGNPTEGERQALLDLQASVSKPVPVRAAALNRLIGLLERREALAREQAEGIRDGSYFKPRAAQPATTSSDGWSGERIK